MNNEQFIKSIIQTVHDSVVNGLLENIENPPGRKPPQSSVELAEWVSELPENEKEKIKKIIKRATHAAIFSFLTVLDGAKAIESSPEKGQLKLFWEKETEKILLNDPENEALHDIYQAEVYPTVFGKEN